jgi:Ca2+-binding RTX toxin-like protein
LKARKDSLQLLDVNASDVRLSRDAANLYVTIGAERIKVANHFDGAFTALEQVQFSDGSTWQRAVLDAAPFRGTDGADTLNGSAGGELFIGGKGADAISGEGGSDIYQWAKGDGNDVLTDYYEWTGNIDTLKLVDVAAGGVTLSRDASHLYITVTATGEKIKVSNHFIAAAYNLERIEFASGNSLLLADLNAAPFRGTNAADTLNGTAGGELLIGGKGADTISGGAGNDTFQWSRGDGNDVISDYDWQAGNVDTLKFTDVAAGGVSLSRDASHLYITVTATGERIQISDHFNGAIFNLERIEFSSGNPLLLAALNAAPFRGTDAADTLSGSGSGELFIGGKGADAISGWGGNDTFQWSKGDGNDTISDDDWQAGNIDTLKLVDVAAGGVSLSRDAFHLYITITATGEKIQVSKHFSAAAYNLERIEFASGNPLLLAALNAAPFRGTDAANTLSGSAGGELFIGGKGADTISGGAGNDTFQWSRGDGNDVISDYDWQAGNVDTLKFTDVAAGGVTLSRDASHLYITVTATGEKIQISNHFEDAAYNLERIEFASGNPLLLTALNAAAFRGTDAADTFNGTAGSDLFIGGKGADTISGSDGNDVYQWKKGDGNDILTDCDWQAGNVDTLKLVDVAAGGVSLSRDFANLYITVIATGEKLQISNHFTAAAFNLERIEFSSGNPLLLAELNAAPFRGTAGADTIMGGNGNDVLDGLAGNDFLAGGAGSDIYRIGRGYGADTLQDIDFTAGNKDVLQFLGGISTKQLWFRHTGYDLEVSIIGTADKATVQNWYLGSFFHVEQIQAGDGKVLLDTQVETLVQAMAGLAPPVMGQLDLSAAYAAQLAPVLAAGWH